MYCEFLRQFLLTCPGERGRLWEVEPPGAWGQRANIWLKVYLQEARLQDGSAVHPECSEEGTDTPRQTSRGDGPTQFDHGESRKECITGGQETQNDQECVKREEDSGMSLRPPWDETEGRGAKRTVAVAGLVGSGIRCLKKCPGKPNSLWEPLLQVNCWQIQDSGSSLVKSNKASTPQEDAMHGTV